MFWLLTGVVCVPLVELVIRLPVAGVARQAMTVSGKAGHILRAEGISDHWKEKAMLAYSGRLFGTTMNLAGLLLIIAVAAGTLIFLCNLVVPGFAGFIMGWQGILATLILASLYALLRARISGSRKAPALDSPYSVLDRSLHHLALGNAAVAEMSFDIDQGMVKPDSETAGQGQHVFVAGLARAGTTILMRRLYGTGAFRSLTYRDMPFVLAPNLWQKLSVISKRDIVRADRAHGDGLEVDADSPESLDEVFWRIFDGPSYLMPDRLVPHTPDAELADKYRAYIGAILARSGRDRYLSKNNNNLLRLPFLADTFPNALILVPFREPLSHAASLARQHGNFGSETNNDPFVRRYMDYLAHHEFGTGHRPFRLGGDPAASTATPDSLDYWLGLWIDVYGWLLDTAPPTARFVSYEALCSDPAIWADLAAAAGLDAESEGTDHFEQRSRKIPEGVNRALTERAHRVHLQLLERSRACCG